MSTKVNAKMRAGMREATRLMRTGNLHESTAAIQRTLRSISATNTAAPTAAADPRKAPIEGTCRVVEAEVFPRDAPASRQAMST